jgi:hypothetical protein
MILRIGSKASSNSYCSSLSPSRSVGHGQCLRSVLEVRACPWKLCIYVGMRCSRPSTLQQPYPIHYPSITIMDDLLQNPVIKNSLLVIQWLQQNSREYLAHILQALAHSHRLPLTSSLLSLLSSLLSTIGAQTHPHRAIYKGLQNRVLPT